jgi:periplasmic divalent cation tolerance protein
MVAGVIVLSTFPSEASINQIARKVVAGRLCACVNFAKIRSIYSWHGKLEDHSEFIALFKTTSKSATRLKAEIAKSHPYDLPEIVELELKHVSARYLSWLAESTDRVSKNRNYASKR